MDRLVLPLDVIIDRLRHGPALHLARYGDGEFLCMMGVNGHNCDDVVYTAPLAQALRETLLDDAVTHGWIKASNRTHAEAWLAEQKISIAWYDGEAIETALYSGTAAPLVDLLRNWRLLQVGPLYLSAINPFRRSGFVPVPERKAFDDLAWTEERIVQTVDHLGANIILISAGPAAKVLVSHLAHRLPNVATLDIGSALDVFAGHPTRSGPARWTKDHIADLWRRNFGGEWHAR